MLLSVHHLHAPLPTAAACPCPPACSRIVAVTGEEAEAAIKLADELAAQVGRAVRVVLCATPQPRACCARLHGRRLDGLQTPPPCGASANCRPPERWSLQVEAAGKLPLAEMQSEVKALTQTVSGEGGM